MAVRFGGTHIDCPSCGAEGQFHKLRDRRVYACPNCLFQIAPTANTILHDTRTPLVSWFYAMYLFCTTRHGVSGKELQRQLGVTYKTAYRIGMQIRKLTARPASTRCCPATSRLTKPMLAVAPVVATRAVANSNKTL
jgi:transposase